jgi:hypothetical protein
MCALSTTENTFSKNKSNQQDDGWETEIIPPVKGEQEHVIIPPFP